MRWRCFRRLVGASRRWRGPAATRRVRASLRVSESGSAARRRRRGESSLQHPCSFGNHPTMRDDHYYEPRLGHGLPHDPFSAIVGPRPIGWISSQSPEGRVNLAPYSFFNAFNYTPPIIGFASIGWKDTVANIEATKQFVWNLATRALME